MARLIGNLEIGSKVKIQENGALVDFIVIKHGYPTLGDGNTLVVRDSLYGPYVWNTTDRNTYAGSTIDTWLSGDYFNQLQIDLRALIPTVNIYYTVGNLNYAVTTIPRKVFLLSAIEVCDTSDSAFIGQKVNIEGSRILYFDNEEKRKASCNGVYWNWWLRSVHKGAGSDERRNAALVSKSGRIAHVFAAQTGIYARPAFVLPSNLLVTDTWEIRTNISPNPPPFVSVSDFIKGGGTAAVSWGAASDPDGNLAGYRLERSINSGGFAQIHDGNVLNFTDNITYGWNTVAYRVRAYDSVGAVSGYATSPTRNIFNNSAPTAPPSISVPEEVKGGKGFTVSWGAATDVDGNLAGYQLERSLNGGNFQQIYLGTDRSVNDTVAKGTGTVAYRVRAYDAENAWSGYTTSATRTVINNTPPSISGVDSNLGTKNDPFSITYSVSDPDGDAITVTEKLDNQVIRSFTAEANKEYQVAFNTDTFRQILNGAHTITVTATDAPGESVTRTWTWTKNVTRIFITMKAPKEPADGGRPYKCLLNINAVLPTGALATVEICNNGFDAQPVWEECTIPARAGDVIFFSNQTKTAEKWGVNFRVTINRSGAPGDCYVTGISGNFEEERS